MSRNPSRTQPAKRLNQRDMDSSCYRLSRVPQKFSMTKAVKSETSESFAVTYYQSNPVDTRTPQEKLEEVDSRLAEKIDDDAKFELLVQKKSLCQMIYGENSAESVKATTELGAFYNEHGKPDSAMRNLQKGQQTAKQADLDEQDAFNLAVELADACLNASSQSKQDKSKQVSQADQALTPYAETESENKLNCFRRDLYLARIRSYRNKWAESLAYYEKAVPQYKDTHPESDNKEEEEEKENPEEANLYVEAGQVAERAEETEKAIEFYKKARDLYQQLGYEEDAKRLDEKIGEEETEEEAANETTEENNESEPKLEQMQIEMKDTEQTEEAEAE